MYDSLWTDGLQHDRLPYPLLSPGVCSNSCLLSWWWHPTISFSVTLFSCPQSFSASGSFPMSWLFSSHRKNYWSFSISPSNEYSGLIPFKIDCFDCLAVQGTLKSLLQHHSLKASVLQYWAFFLVQLSHPYMTTGKTIAEMTDLLLLLWPDYFWNIVVNFFFKYSLLS